MKKLIVSLVVGVALAVTYWLVSPFFIDQRVSEEFPVAEQIYTADVNLENAPMKDYPQQIASGSFAGFDSIHYGSGTALLLQTETGYVVRFEDDFHVANGPDLYVGLGHNGQYQKGSEISRLKGNISSQNYTLPENFDINTTNEIWIWCKAFSVPFAKVVFVQ